METLMKLANGSANRDLYQYTGMKHNKNFISMVKPHRTLFSTYEPLSNFEARYNATARILHEQEQEARMQQMSSASPKKETPTAGQGYRFNPKKLPKRHNNNELAQSVSSEKFRSVHNFFPSQQSERGTETKSNRLLVDI